MTGQWDADDAEIQVTSGENPELLGILFFKPGVDYNIILYVSPANLYLHSSFILILSKVSLIIMHVGTVNEVSPVEPRNRIGHFV